MNSIEISILHHSKNNFDQIKISLKNFISIHVNNTLFKVLIQYHIIVIIHSILLYLSHLISSNYFFNSIFFLPINSSNPITLLLLPLIPSLFEFTLNFFADVDFDFGGSTYSILNCFCLISS